LEVLFSSGCLDILKKCIIFSNNILPLKNLTKNRNMFKVYKQYENGGKVSIQKKENITHD